MPSASTQLGPLERAFLRRQIRVAVLAGKLPSDALSYLRDEDFSQTLEDTIVGQSTQDITASGGKLQSILQWLMQNLPQIIQIVMTLIGAFGGATTAPKTVGPGSAGLERAKLESRFAEDSGWVGADECDHESMPTSMAIPPWAIGLVEQVAANVLEKVLPTIEQYVNDWIKSHLAQGTK